MNGLDQFVTSIVEQTIESLHDRGLLILEESDEQKAAFLGGSYFFYRNLIIAPKCAP